MTPYKWNPEVTKQAKNLHAAKKSYEDIADEIGCTPKQAQGKMRCISQGLESTRPIDEQVRRICNMCKEDFLAQTRFLRTCNKCKDAYTRRGGL